MLDLKPLPEGPPRFGGTWARLDLAEAAVRARRRGENPHIHANMDFPTASRHGNYHAVPVAFVPYTPLT